MLKYILPVLLFFILFGFLFIGLYKDPSEVPSPLINKPVPQFTLPLLSDPERIFSNENLLGKVSLLNVWGTWCFACKQEHPVLNELAELKIVPIYGLNYKDDTTKAKQYLTTFGNPYAANAVDAEGRAAIEWGVYGAPETFVIDKNGIIRHKHIGPLTVEDVQKTLLPMLERLQSE